jgi:hypothetical protein
MAHGVHTPVKNVEYPRAIRRSISRSVTPRARSCRRRNDPVLPARQMSDHRLNRTRLLFPTHTVTNCIFAAHGPRITPRGARVTPKPSPFTA